MGYNQRTKNALATNKSFSKRKYAWRNNKWIWKNSGKPLSKKWKLKLDL